MASAGWSASSASRISPARSTFANAIGGAAEEQGHHPALLVEWGKVTVSWWTHAIGGLHRNDFIMAARTDALYEQAPGRKA